MDIEIEFNLPYNGGVVNAMYHAFAEFCSNPPANYSRLTVDGSLNPIEKLGVQYSPKPYSDKIVIKVPEDLPVIDLQKIYYETLIGTLAKTLEILIKTYGNLPVVKIKFIFKPPTYLFSAKYRMHHIFINEVEHIIYNLNSVEQIEEILDIIRTKLRQVGTAVDPL